MTHIEEGRMRAWLDEELSPPEAERLALRVEGDPDLRRRMEDLQRDEACTRDLLARLEVPPAPAARVRAIVEAARRNDGTAPRSDGTARRNDGTLPRNDQAARRNDPRHRPGAGAGRRPGGWARRSRLAQAAGLLLVFAGAAAAAIPGSPVRAWLVRSLGPGTAAERPAEPQEQDMVRPADEETGLMIAPHEGRIRVELLGLPTGTEIVVRLTEEDRGGVFAPLDAGLELEGEEGRIRATGSGGPVRVELPRAVPRADLLVDGRVVLVKAGDELDLHAPAIARTATEIRLRAGS